MRARFLAVVAACLAISMSIGGAAGAATAVVSLSPAAGPPTTRVAVKTTGFTPGESVRVSFDSQQLATATATSTGAASAAITVPRSARPGSHTISAVGASSGAAGAATFVVRTDWSQFRFDQAHNGYQPYENVLNASNVPMLQLSWQAQLGDRVDYSSPAVVNGVAYIGSSDGRLWAYSANGCGQQLCTTPLWSSTSLGQIIDSPTVVGGLVYVGSQTSSASNAGKLDVFNAAGCGRPTCAPLWQGAAGQQSILQSSPTVTGGRVYIGAFDGKLYVFNASGCGAALCQPVWTGSTGGPIESTPTVSGSTVFVGSNDGKLYAFPAAGCGASTCRPLWTGATGEQIFDSSPAVANGNVYVGATHHLNAFAAAGCGASTCAPLWQGSHQTDYVNGSPAVFSGHVYIGLEYGIGVFNAGGCGAASCAPAWIDFGSGAQADIVSSPTVANGVVYAGKNNGQVLAWKAGSCGQFVCNEIWSFTTKDPIVSSSPTVVNGKVYIGGSNNIAPPTIAGRLYVFG